MIKLYAANYTNQAEFGFGTGLLKNKGIMGKASRFGYKKAKRGLRKGKAIGGSVVNGVKNSRTFRTGRVALKKQFRRFRS